jgi:hypothetical protein
MIAIVDIGLAEAFVVHMHYLDQRVLELIIERSSAYLLVNIEQRK